MTTALSGWLGAEPASYARKILKECGLIEPPFCERTIAEFLKIDIHEISRDDIEEFRQLSPEFPSIETFITESCTFMQTDGEGNRIIFTPAEVSAARKRMNILHECGHVVVPWHDQYCYLCKNKDMDPGVRKQIEREAFICASEFLMPRLHFIEDALGLGIMGVSAIEILSKRYHASLEAAANWFAYTHPGICSVLLVEPTNPANPEIIEQQIFPADQKLLRVGAPYSVYNSEEPEGVPLKVKYAIRSRRFPDYIRPNTAIAEGSPIHKAWIKKQTMRGEIPATTFGFLHKAPYQFECLPLGFRDKMLVLLWEEDRQKRLIYEGKELIA